jgi:hypothetical protein
VVGDDGEFVQDQYVGGEGEVGDEQALLRVGKWIEGLVLRIGRLIEFGLACQSLREPDLELCTSKK